MSPVELIADYPCHVGEAPLWHPDEQCVYWSDIPAGKLYRYTPATGTGEVCYEGRPVGGLVLQKDGSLLLFRDGGNIVVWRQGRKERTIVDAVADLRNTRFNDVCVDPEGRIFCGTMADLHHFGRLYRLELDGTLTRIFDGLGTPNGMGFSPDQKTLYFNDSYATFRTTWAFDYDRSCGELCNRRALRDAKHANDPGNPDGLAVDSEGFVWTARWDGNCLLRHSPEDGEVVENIAFPVRKVSSLCFGGPDLADIYATTAGGHLRPTDGVAAGSLFRIRNAPAPGLPRFTSDF
jgi:sugar lactone lactonase YvrE